MHFCIGAMQKHVLVIWAAIAHIQITPGRVPPPISVRECSPLEVLPNGIFQKLSRVFAIRLFFFSGSRKNRTNSARCCGERCSIA